MRMLITGGAGFVGASLARFFLNHSGMEVVLLDNLRRRGSETTLSSLIAAGAQFVHGDVRNPDDLDSLTGTFDLLIEASAEPSVHAGMGESPRYVLDTNLGGAINCLEFARNRCGGLVFLSTSRVYSLEPLRTIKLIDAETRFEFDQTASQVAGVTGVGISESFPCSGPRSYYGASKLAAELLCQEYAAHSSLRVVVNRCGVIAGPGQFGKTDQGVFTLWVARHMFGNPLKYTGFGGKGHQVRDLLHPLDLAELIALQAKSLDVVSGQTFNAGGGHAGSVSLAEFTGLCKEVTGRDVSISEDPATNPVDVPWYITDNYQVTKALGWRPSRDPRRIVADIAAWIEANRQVLKGVIT